MPIDSTLDCTTMKTAASYQPAGSIKARGNTKNELRVPMLKASVRPCSAARDQKYDQR